MQRGILNLAKEQSLVALQLIKKSSQNLSQLEDKLELAVNSNQNSSTIEVNRDEVEALLDAFPIPSDSEEASYKSLRNSLVQFLGGNKNGS